MDALPPELAGRYRLVRPLGCGGFGEVLLVHDRQLDRPLALKLLHPQVSRDPRLAARFEREARLAARVRSPRVAEIFDHGVAGDRLYLLSDFVPGPTLAADLVARGTLDPDEACRLLQQVLEGLAAVHAAGVVHRDLKPENVLLRGGAEVVLVDFGVARAADGEDLTRTGESFGTPLSMAPEQMTGGEPGPDWDLYAAGVLLHRMLVGEAPFEGASLAELHAEKLRGAPPGPRARGAPVPAALDRMLGRWLSPERAVRPTAADAAARELEACLRESETEAASTLVLPGPEALPTRATQRTATPVRASQASQAPRAAGTRRPGRARAGLLLAGLGLVGGLWLARRWAATPSPGAPPGTPRPAPGGAEAAAHLERVLAAVRAHPGIRAGVDLTAEITLDEAVERWKSGRVSFARLVRPLRPELEALARAPLDRGVHQQVTALRFYQHVFEAHALERSHQEEHVGPLHPDHDGPDLDGYLARGLDQETLEGPHWSPRRIEEALGRRGELFPLLGLGGSWATLVDHQEALPSTRRGSRILQIFTLAGTQFRLSPQGGGVRFDELVFEDHAADTIPACEARLHPYPGDLELVLIGYDWGDPAFAGELCVLGEGGDESRVYLRIPPRTRGRDPGTGEPVRTALRLRLARALLPPAPTRIRVTARGAQWIGDQALSVNVDEIHQRVGP